MVRFLPVLALCACGMNNADTGYLVQPDPTETTDDKKNKKPKEDCLDIGTMTMDMTFGWDAKEGLTKPMINTLSGLPVRSSFTVFLGARDWDGDTSLPGAPDRWCFVEWTIDNWSADPAGFGDTMSLSGVDVGQGVTNCGRESAPGASDFVPLCGDYFGDEDPVVAMTPYAWEFGFGGLVPMSVAGIPYYFQSAGYTEENFWGSGVDSSLFNRIDTLTYGWAVDDDGQTILGYDGTPVKITRDEFDSVDGVPSGLYFHLIPWIFPL